MKRLTIERCVAAGMTAAVAAVCLGAPKSARAAQEPPERYVVIKGDTLWDIAELFYDSGFAWQKIHELNTDLIKNPDLIYPQQSILLPGGLAKKPPKTEVQVATKEAPAEPAQETMPEVEVAVAKPPEPTATPVAAVAAPSVQQAAEFKDYDGKIIASRNVNQVMFAQGDDVFVNLGAKHGLVTGDELQIVRKQKRAYDPKAKKKYWIVQVMGKLRVSKELYDDRSECRILFAHEPVSIGDGVVRLAGGLVDGTQ
ncbi:MAG: LysM peptidoglycan-binding domain-containing protein [Elusimicrobia bacterium]|nr:LysM peptidoglycan-binding domain-containing protein [Elusimicrobiota bacterium]